MYKRQRLDRAIHTLLSGHLDPVPSRSQVAQWIESGQVALNGRAQKKSSALVHTGSSIALQIPPAESSVLKPLDLALTILFEDDDLLVLNKPAGLSMHPGAGNRDTTLANALVAHFAHDNPGSAEALPRAGIVHRLDKDTTGVLVVAKRRSIHDQLAKQFAERTIVRSYRALALLPPRSTLFRSEQGSISAALGRDAHDRRKMAVVSTGGKHAVTHWSVVERMPFGCLLDLRLETGRTHQIRVHLHNQGTPIIGDLTYRRDQVLPSTLARAASAYGRQALHAATLEFTHPGNAQRLSFSAAVPADMQELIALFRNYSAGKAS
mgnify:CR=1 FL=1